MENKLYGKNYLDSVYHLGVGWGFDLPMLEMSGNYPMYLHLGQGATYGIDLSQATGLHEAVFKEYIFQQIPNSQTYLLKHKSGLNYYFNFAGKLYKIENRYGNVITFNWKSDTTLGYYLDSVIDTVGRVIKFTYTDTEVTVQVQSTASPFVIKYKKQPCGDNQSELYQVDLPEETHLYYMYKVEKAEFTFDSSLPPLTRNYLTLILRQNPYGGTSNYAYYKAIRPLELTGKDEYFKLYARYEYLNYRYQNYVNYFHYYHDLGRDYYTEVLYCGDNPSSWVKKDKYFYDKEHQNIKTETYYADQPNLTEVKSSSYIYKYPDKIKVTTQDSTRPGLTYEEFTDLDYDTYGNIIRTRDSADKLAESSYSLKTLNQFTYQVLDWNRSQVNPVGTQRMEFVGGNYYYDSYGNLTTEIERELNGYYSEELSNLINVPSPVLKNKPEVWFKELPEGSKTGSLRFYYFARFGTSVAWEVRYWEQGKPRPETSFKSYVHTGWFGNISGYETISLPALDPAKRYFVEVAYTGIAVDNSITILNLDVTYRKLFLSSQDKSTTRYHYASPATVSLPDKTHLEYGSGGAVHDNTFATDSCIVNELEYLAAVDNPQTGENYTNLFPSKVVQYYLDADGVAQTQVTAYRYNGFGQITEIRKVNTANNNTLVTKYIYDGLSRLKSEVYQDVRLGIIQRQVEKNYAYSAMADARGLFSTTISHKEWASTGYVTTLYYDKLGRYIETRKGPAYQDISIEGVYYDGFGRKIAVEDGNALRTEFTYDSNGRTVEIRMIDITKPSLPERIPTYKKIIYDDVARTVTEETYDFVAGGYFKVSKTVQHLNQAGQVKQLDRYPLATDESNIHKTSYTYNLSDQITSMVDPRNVTISYDYDFFGVKQITYPGTIRAADVCEYNYLDKTKQAKKVLDPGVFITTEFDELDRVKKLTYPDGTVVKNYYDFAGRLSRTEKTAGAEISTITYEYDLTGGPKTVNHTYPGKRYTITYGYDMKGNLTSIRYPNGLNVSYIYDIYDRVVKIPGYVQNGTADGVEYQNNGFMTRLTYANGISTDYTPDSLGRLGTIKNQFMEYSYTYDGKSNVRRIISKNSVSNTSYDYYYIYNDLDWLVEAGNDWDLFTVGIQAPNTFEYSYDPAGNRLTQKINGVLTSYEYDPNSLNLLTRVNGQEVTYNKWGNISKRESGYEYTFDYANQLTKVSRKSRILGEYFYNSEGKRYKKVEDGRTNYYVYSGENILYEEANGLPICYIYLNGRHVAKVKVGGVVEYYHTDNLGSTRLVTSSTGQALGSVEYTPFGDEKPYFPASGSTASNYSSLDSTNDITGTFYGTKNLCTDRVEGSAAIAVDTGFDLFASETRYQLYNRNYYDADFSRYIYLWVKPESNADWIKFRSVDTDDPSNFYEYLTPEDGKISFEVGKELERDKWNLVVLDNREGSIDGIDHRGNLEWATDIYSKWKWDYVGISKKESLTYTGKGQDDPTGLYYFNARYYDPLLGRFVSEDVARDGDNWYLFCANNPLKYVDTDGRKTVVMNARGGIEAHKVISEYFKKLLIEQGATGVRVDLPISTSLFGEIIDRSRPDLVAYFPIDREVYEIKQGVTWGLLGESLVPAKKFELGVKCLVNKYVLKIEGAKRGTSLPTYVKLNFPYLGPKGYLEVYTYPVIINGIDATGMIYYFANDGEDGGKKSVQTPPQSIAVLSGAAAIGILGIWGGPESQEMK